MTERVTYADDRLLMVGFHAAIEAIPESCWIRKVVLCEMQDCISGFSGESLSAEEMARALHRTVSRAYGSGNLWTYTAHIMYEVLIWFVQMVPLLPDSFREEAIRLLRSNQPPNTLT